MVRFKEKSTWKPPPGPPNLEFFNQLNELALTKIKHPKLQDNLTQKERKALRTLSSNKEIIIFPADKGGATVIQNTKDYIKEAERQLSDTNFYKKIDTDLTNKHKTQIKNLVENLIEKNEISKNVGDILIGKKTRTPQIYFLPKVHKKKNPPPGRPIVSANDCPTERISAFVDTFLRPYVEKGWSYVKDTNDFVKQIREIEPLKEGTILASFDVNSLYTNIPNKEAIDHIQTTLEGDWLPDHKPSVKTLCTMLDYILI